MNPLYENLAKHATVDQLAEARDSLIEWGCDEGNDRDEVTEFVAARSDAQVVRAIDRGWCGGWSQFRRDIVPVELDR